MISKKEQKYIQSLKIKKYRSREKRFLVEGAKNVLELLSSDFEVEIILSTEEFSQQLGQVSSKHRVEIVSEKLLSQIGNFKTNQTCLAQVRQKDQRSLDWNKKDHLFVLDGVGDPGNLGTIIRTLDWFGFYQLVCSQDCAEFYHPKTIASTMGSFTRMDIFYENLEETLMSLGTPILGADAHGIDIYELALDSPSIIVMGNESHGIRSEVTRLLTEKIAIPKSGKAESLNVGVAAGIIAGYLRNSR